MVGIPEATALGGLSMLILKCLLMMVERKTVSQVVKLLSNMDISI